MLRIYDEKDRLVAISEAALAIDAGAWCFLPVVPDRFAPPAAMQAERVVAHRNHTHLPRVHP